MRKIAMLIVVVSVALLGVFAFRQVSAILRTPVEICEEGECWDSPVGSAEARPNFIADEGANCSVIDVGTVAPYYIVRCCPGDPQEGGGPGYYNVDITIDTTTYQYGLHYLDNVCYPRKRLCYWFWPLANYRYNRMDSLLDEVLDLIEQAREKDIDVSKYEAIVKDAEKCMVMAKKWMQGRNFCAANTCLAKNTKYLLEAKEELEKLLQSKFIF